MIASANATMPTASALVKSTLNIVLLQSNVSRFAYRERLEQGTSMATQKLLDAASATQTKLSVNNVNRDVNSVTIGASFTGPVNDVRTAVQLVQTTVQPIANWVGQRRTNKVYDGSW